jgi:small-conductance mechanosensitive channel
MKLAAATSIDIIREAREQELPYAEQTPSEGMAIIIGSMLSTVMVVAVIIVLFILVQSAISWITAGGDSGKVEKARTRMMNALIGLIMLSATIAVMVAIQNFLGVDVLRFGNGGNEPNAAAAIPTIAP